MASLWGWGEETRITLRRKRCPKEWQEREGEEWGSPGQGQPVTGSSGKCSLLGKPAIWILLVANEKESES